jgi:hypothetical protein
MMLFLPMVIASCPILCLFPLVRFFQDVSVAVNLLFEQKWLLFSRPQKPRQFCWELDYLFARHLFFYGLSAREFDLTMKVSLQFYFYTQFPNIHAIIFLHVTVSYLLILTLGHNHSTVRRAAAPMLPSSLLTTPSTCSYWASPGTSSLPTNGL